MNIQPVNTSFKGAYKANSQTKNIEYHPYSWECNAEGQFGPAEYKEINLKSAILPDNTNRPANSKIKIMKTMNRADSLADRTKKAEQFISLKESAANELKTIIENAQQNIFAANYTYAVTDSQNRKDAIQKVSAKNSKKLFKNLREYFVLRDSIDLAKEAKHQDQLELILLRNAKENKNLIDISRRDIKNPDKALISSVTKMIKNKTLESSKKIIALPHKSVSIQEILKELGERAQGENVLKNVMIYVNSLIKNCR